MKIAKIAGNTFRKTLVAALLVSTSVASVFIQIQTIAYADTETAPPEMKLTPSILEVDTNPGENSMKTIKFTNESELSFFVSVGSTTYSVDRYGSPNYETIMADFDTEEWIKVEPIEFVIEADSEREVDIEISTPENASPGSHLATIMFKPTFPAEYFTADSARVTHQIGAILAINVYDGNQGKNSNIEIKDFNTQKYSDNPKAVQFNIMLKNSDVYYHKIEGEIKVTNILGKTVKNVEIERLTVHPEMERIITRELEEELGFGRYTAVLNLECEEEELQKKNVFWIYPDGSDILKMTTLTGFILSVIFSTFLLMRGRENLIKAFKTLILKKE